MRTDNDKTYPHAQLHYTEDTIHADHNSYVYCNSTIDLDCLRLKILLHLATIKSNPNVCIPDMDIPINNMAEFCRGQVP